MTKQNNKQISLKEMKDRLLVLYKEEDEIKAEYRQLREDIELLELMVMHQCNKKSRFGFMRKR